MNSCAVGTMTCHTGDLFSQFWTKGSLRHGHRHKCFLKQRITLKVRVSGRGVEAGRGATQMLNITFNGSPLHELTRQKRSDEQWNAVVTSDIFHRKGHVCFLFGLVKVKGNAVVWCDRMLEGHTVGLSLLQYFPQRSLLCFVSLSFTFSYIRKIVALFFPV